MFFQIKTLRDLFDDDTVFIALSANEKFPEDGIELDPNSKLLSHNLQRSSFYLVQEKIVFGHPHRSIYIEFHIDLEFYVDLQFFVALAFYLGLDFMLI